MSTTTPTTVTTITNPGAGTGYKAVYRKPDIIRLFGRVGKAGKDDTGVGPKNQPYKNGLGTFTLEMSGRDLRGNCRRWLEAKWQITVDDPIEIEAQFDNASSFGCTDKNRVAVTIGAFYNNGKYNQRIEILNKNNVWVNLRSISSNASTEGTTEYFDYNTLSKHINPGQAFRFRSVKQQLDGKYAAYECAKRLFYFSAFAFPAGKTLTTEPPVCAGGAYTVKIPYNNNEKYIVTIKGLFSNSNGKNYEIVKNSQDIANGGYYEIRDRLDRGDYKLTVEHAKGNENDSPCPFEHYFTIHEIPALTMGVTSYAFNKRDNAGNEVQISGFGRTGRVNVPVSGSATRYVTISSGGYNNTSYLSGTETIAGRPYYSGTAYIDLPAGTHTIHAHNSSGCVSVAQQITLAQPDPIQFGVSITQPDCHVSSVGGNTHNAALRIHSISGGIGGYHISPAASQDGSDYLITGLPAQNNLVLTVADGEGNAPTFPVDIPSPAPLYVNIDRASPPTLSCSDDASIEVSAIGGEAPYTYSRINHPALFGSSAVIGGYSSGQQHVYIQDSKGCIGEFPVTIAGAPEALTVASMVATPVTCNGYDDGQCVLTIKNAQGVLSVSDAPVSISNISISGNKITVTGLMAGNHSLTISDTYNSQTCSLPVSFTITDKDPVSISHTVTPVSDKGTATGRIALNISGANSGNYTVSLFDKDDRPLQQTTTTGTCTFSGLAGEAANDGKLYKIEVVDPSGCTYSEHAGDTYPVKIPEPTDKLKLSVGLTKPVSCRGNADAAISLTARGGWEGYRYSKDNITWLSSPDVTGLAAGKHQFYVTDLYGGKDSVSITITQPTLLTAVIDSIQPVLCQGGSTGWIRYKVSGGTYPYTFAPVRGSIASFNGADTLLTATTLAAGTHKLTVKDQRGCTFVSPQAVVTEPARLQVEITEISHTTCEQHNGTIKAVALGGSGSYTHTLTSADLSWQVSRQLPATAAIFFEQVPPGTYKLITVDEHLCTATSPLKTVNGYVNPAVASSQNDDVTCYGEDNGKITVHPSVGTAPIRDFTISSSDPVFTQTNASGVFGPLAPGIYTIDLSDTNGCQSSQPYPVQIQEPEYLSVSVDAIHPVIGKGTASGHIAFHIDGGNTGLKDIRLTHTDNGHTYDMKNRSGVALLFQNLPAGNYTMQLTDRKACAAQTGVLQINEPTSALGFTVTAKEDARCKSQTGSITVEAFGGWGDYRYKRAINSAYAPRNTFEKLYAGNYIITVTDKMGATYSETITVYEPKDSLTAEVTGSLPPVCGNDGSLSVKISGGTQPYQLAENTNIMHLPHPQTVHLANRESGAHLLLLTDGNGCRFDLETTLPDTSLLKITALEITHPSVAGASDGAVKAIVQGGRTPYTTQWKHRFGAAIPGNTLTLNHIPAGHYQVDITEAGGCTVSGQVYLPDPDDASFEIITMGHETGYEKRNGYAVLYPDISDVTDFELITPANTRLTYTNTSVTAVFHTDNDTVYLQQLQAGDWFISGRNAKGQRAVQAFQIAPYQQFSISRVDTEHVRKPGASDGSVRIEVSGGAGNNRFEWKNASGTMLPSVDDRESSILQNIGAGIYTVSVTDRYGNIIRESIEVKEPAKALTIGIASYRNESCKTYQDAYVMLKAEGGWGDYQFRHDTEKYPANSPTYQNLPVRQHYFYLTDSYGATDSIAVQITEPEFLRSSVALVDSVNCKDAADGFIHFNITGGTEPYRWAYKNLPTLWTNGNLSEGLPEGNHTYIFSDSNGCTGQDTLKVYMPEPDALLFADVQVTHTTCNEDNGQMTVCMQGGTAPYRYQWTDAGGQPAGDSNHATGLKRNGFYRLTVTDRHACRQERSQAIQTSTLPQVNDILTTPALCYGDTTGTATVTGVTAAQPYAPWQLTWSDGVQANTSKFPYGLHYVTVADTNGCASVHYFDITQPDSLYVTLTNSKEPHCFGYDDGFLLTEAHGGVGGYQYLWGNGSDSPLAENLAAGTWHLLLRDGNNCRYQRAFVLEEPAEQRVDVGGDAVICPGNQHVVDGQDYPAHRWYTTSGDISAERYLTVDREDNYYLEATDLRGCPVKGGFKLSIGNNALIADFLLPSEAILSDTLILYELSNMALDSMRWVYDHSIFSRVEAPKDMEYVLRLSGNAIGMYNIDLYAWSGGCTSRATWPVEIIGREDAGKEDDGLGYKDPLIQSLTVYPNPNNGLFTVEVILREKHDIRFSLFGVASGMRVNDRFEYGLKEYALDYNLPKLNTGVYVLVLTAGGERKQVKIVIEN